MFSANEHAPLHPGLTDGLQTLSNAQAIKFTRYLRRVLPLDGYIFWCGADSRVIDGSLHVGVQKQQREDETIAINRVVFTAGEDIQEFNTIRPDEMWIGEAGGVKFAFSANTDLYRAADLWHYVGDAVYPALESQIIPPGFLPPEDLIVSNSLPAWLRLQTYCPIWLVPPNPGIALYPSFAVPDNIRPPYGAVHIDPGQTRALASAPLLDRKASQGQLASDRVRVTLYGLNNEAASSFLDTVFDFSGNFNHIGMMNMPIIRDEKRTQAELGILAMRKVIDFEVSYLQGAMRHLARAIIEEATATFLPQPSI